MRAIYPLRPRHYHEAREIFVKLTDDSCYRNCFHGEKLNIIAHIISVKSEFQRFARAKKHKPHTINGRLMEYCARFSDQLPRNTPEAEECAKTITAYLQKKIRCNPDYIWFDLRGKRITLTGIGEVKSHINNIKYHHPQQTTRQERNVFACMQPRIAASLFPAKRVSIAPDMKRYLIVPRNNNSYPYRLPDELHYTWEIKEIEFTFEEMLFLKDYFLQ